MKPLISVITPTLNEADNVVECYSAVREIFQRSLANFRYEHIFADNASTDKTAEVLRGLAEQDANVKVILNSRNVGPFRSTFNALRHATGDAVLVQLPADLQDPPELIPEMVAKWIQGYQVVYGVRSTREESLVLASTRRFYYRLLAMLADISIPPDAGEFQLIDRSVANELITQKDYYPYIRGMIAECGFNATGIRYVWRRRKRGRSRLRIYHLFDQALNGLVSFTNVPLRLATMFGFVVAAVSLLYSMVHFILAIVFYRELAPPGIASLIIALFFFGGIQLFFIGVLGEYVNAIHSQVRGKGRVIERERINLPEKPRTPSQV